MQLKTSLRAVKKELEKVNKQSDEGVYIVRVDDETEKISVYRSGKKPKTMVFDTFEDYEQFYEKQQKGTSINRGVFIIDNIPRSETVEALC